MSRLARIERLLADYDGIGLINFADVSANLLLRGERDSTGDISGMSRMDSIWSVTIALGIAQTLARLMNRGLQVENADVYYDTREIKEQHRQALSKTVIRTLAEVIKQAVREGYSHRGNTPKVRRFLDIPKAPKGNKPNKFQSGIAVAHVLLQNWKHIFEHGATGNLDVHNSSEDVANYLSHFKIIVK